VGDGQPKAFSAEARDVAASDASSHPKPIKIEPDLVSQQSTNFDCHSLREIESLQPLSTAVDIRDFSKMLRQENKMTKLQASLTPSILIKETEASQIIPASDPTLEKPQAPQSKPGEIQDQEMTVESHPEPTERPTSLPMEAQKSGEAIFAINESDPS
jgi:hypothetical protein